MLSGSGEIQVKELTDESLARLAAKGAGSGEARELLYRRFLPLLAGTARRFGCPRETEDLIQEGYFGLVAAAERYREETGVPFRFYALLWIRRSMGRYLEQCSGLIRIPAAKRALMRKYRRLAESWEIGHGQKLPDCRAALLLGIPEKGLAALKRNMAMEEPESLEALLEQEAPRGPEPAREGPEDEILDKITGAALKEALLACLEGLPEEAAAAESFGKVVKEKNFDISIVTVDDAIAEMDLLDHDFYVFVNAENNKVSVVYKRHDGDYGLITPEY